MLIRDQKLHYRLFLLLWLTIKKLVDVGARGIRWVEKVVLWGPCLSPSWAAA